jgi:hypothetical protein
MKERGSIDLILTRQGYEDIMEAHNKLVQVLQAQPGDKTEITAYHEFMLRVMTILREDVFLEPLKEYV